MNWNLEFRKKKHTLKSVDSVRAVCPTREFKSKANRKDYADAFGAVLPEKAEVHPPPVIEFESVQEMQLPEKDRRTFERAGWRFVAPNAQVAEAARLRKKVPNA